MHQILPYAGWRNAYRAEADPQSPFYGGLFGAPRNGEFHRMFDFVIHPEWEFIGCETLYIKHLYANYEEGLAIIEVMGEWNDALNNDIMHFKRNVVDPMLQEGIQKFLIIGDNLLNYHADANDYYAEWSEEVEEGWIVGLNFRPQVVQDLQTYGLSSYWWTGERFEYGAWRASEPLKLGQMVDEQVNRHLGL